VYLMVDIHLSAGGNELRIIHKKYSDPFFGYVAFLSPTNLPDDDSSTSSNSIDSSAQDGGLKTTSQLKAKKHTAQSLTATLIANCLLLVQLNIHKPKGTHIYSKLLVSFIA